MSELDIKKIMEYLPHRYPFLLVDRVTESCQGEFLSAYKNVSVNEPYFQGHFPGQPIMPGVLILEALAQATGLLTFSSMNGDHSTKQYMLVGIDKSRFRGQVVPGDRLKLNVRLKRNMRGIGIYECRALVGDTLVAEAEMMCSAQDRGT
ncbi:MAG: 3-hydroxyacyl-ACP dehydratase FabZ [Gammaproteobacteria bacterium]|nr:3-hydroxyacyl-ACP dehydratase FabZ [Gammaproteobacteria bacterium]